APGRVGPRAAAVLRAEGAARSPACGPQAVRRRRGRARVQEAAVDSVRPRSRAPTEARRLVAMNIHERGRDLAHLPSARRSATSLRTKVTGSCLSTVKCKALLVWSYFATARASVFSVAP